MQQALFDAQPLASLPGLRFDAQLLTPAEEAHWLAVIATLELSEARYKSYTARRRVLSYGGRFDYDTNRLLPGEPIPAAFEPLRERIAAWLGVEPVRFSQLLVAEYRPGTPLGWHRDVPDFESIAAISLGGHATLKLRPYPHVVGRRDAALTLELLPRSAYVLEGAARWGWQHCIVATRELRHSITLRTRRGSAPLLTRREGASRSDPSGGR